MEQLVKFKDFDVCSTSLSSVEFSDNFERAILTIPLMHFGPNKKGLFWTDTVLKEITPLFSNVPFRYDLDGKEGSSHTVNKLSSPFFDVGWTYEGEEGAWYDPKAKTLWVKGEVTHPQVIEKLRRKTSDGKREVNFASMGIIVDEAKCSICGNEYDECDHERLGEYAGRICYKVPVKCSKGLHAALTNDAADGEAVISDCIFQEMGDKMNTKKFYSEGSAPPQEPRKSSVTNTQVSPNDAEQPSNYYTNFKLGNQIPGGLAPSSPQTGQPGMAPSPEEILRNLAERIKTIENAFLAREAPEIVNAAPQDQYTQSNMGMTRQNMEENTMANENIGQTIQGKVPENPPKPEVQETGDMMMQVMNLLQQIASKLGVGATETQDVEDLKNATKEKIVHDETEPMEQKKPGDMVSKEASTSEGNKKNKEYMSKPDMVATADNEISGFKKELADMQNQMKKLRGKLEIQDNDVPEFGGSPTGQKLEAADMSASERATSFGDYGKWDAIFSGTESAKRFVR